MNKLILVGNGFDLAHGLPTSYKDFLNDFWANLSENYKKQKLVIINEDFGSFFKYSGKKATTYEELILNLQAFCKDYEPDFLSDEVSAKYGDKIIFQISNSFFEIINNKNSIQNWVDIENEYYLELKEIIKNDKYLKKDKKEKILILNQNFKEVKELLLKYLSEKVEEKFNPIKCDNLENFNFLLEEFKPNSTHTNPFNFEEFSFKEDEDYLTNLNKTEISFKTTIGKTYILNFNFTDYTFLYHLELGKLLLKSELNSIHGDLNSEEFKPVFGFGDEMDKDYKLIEDLDDNEYLRFFKSFQYFQNSCYNGLLEFIDSGKFQLSIMGHSCGLSDRVMLNTIFEHKNCRSIKIYYYLRENGSDNYTELVQNISRHFKDKPLMRRKIVSKELSFPLPQTVRFKKK